MIKLLKLQKAVFVIVAGLLSYIAYKILQANKIESAVYFRTLAGILVILGALWLLFPIIFAKKDNDGNAEIITDPTVEIPVDQADEKPQTE